MDTKRLPGNTRRWLKYAGLTGRFIIMIIFGLWAGIRLDGKTGTAIPWFTFSLPLLIITSMLIKVVADTGNKTGQKKS